MDLLSDDTLCYWWHTRFAPGTPSMYLTFGEIPVRVYFEASLMDKSFAVTGQQLG